MAAPFHPSAEGHAAMADAALPAAREALGLKAPPEVIAAAAAAAGRAGRAAASVRSSAHATPSFFCRLDDDVVYWNVSFLSG